MRQFHKRILSVMLVLVTAISLLSVSGSGNTVMAAGETMTVTTSASEVIIDQEVTVTVTLNCPTGLYAAMFNLNYDATMFTYVSGDAGGTSYSGLIPLNYMDSAVPTTYSWTLKFKAVKTGTSNFTIQGDTFIDKNVEGFTPAYTNASVKVWAQGSDDATLSTLQVAGFTLNPAFGKWTTDYIVYVDSNTTAVDIVAQATQAAQGGRVEIAGNTTNLAFGSNFVTIKSYAPNGKVITYNMNIVRLDPPTEPPTTEPPTEPPAWSEVVVDGNSYNISSDFIVDQIPAGFVSTLYDYKGNEILGVVNNTLGLDLLYLVDGEQNGKFFIYDKVADSFYPYIVIYSLNNSYIVLPIDVAEDSPTSGTKSILTIGEQQINGLVDNEDGNFSYFYGINQNGEYSWYCYDSVEGTIQRFHNVVMEAPTDEEETTSKAEPTPENNSDSNYNSEKESLLAENSGLIKIRNIAFAVAAVLLFILIGLVVFLIAHKSEEKHANKGEKVDYVELEKEIEASEKNESEDIDLGKEAVNNTDEVDVASVYDEAISMQMAATKETADTEDDLLSAEEDEEINRMLEEVDADDDVSDGSEQPEIISLDEEELL